MLLPSMQPGNSTLSPARDFCAINARGEVFPAECLGLGTPGFTPYLHPSGVIHSERVNPSPAKPG
jgi:hypothetical protein